MISSINTSVLIRDHNVYLSEVFYKVLKYCSKQDSWEAEKTYNKIITNSFIKNRLERPNKFTYY